MKRDDEWVLFGLLALVLLGRKRAGAGPMFVQRQVYVGVDTGDGVVNYLADRFLQTARKAWVSPAFNPPPDPAVRYRAVDDQGNPGESIGEGEAPYPTWREFWKTGDYPPGAERMRAGDGADVVVAP